VICRRFKSLLATPMEVTMTTRFLRKRSVAERYGITIRTVERMTEDGRLPKPSFRGRIPLWRESELEEFDKAATLAPRPKRDTAEKIAAV
jgi:predicted DNA-binding transcriptional regulator AlpA